MGSLFIADTNNNRIRMVNPAGIMTTVAGGGNLVANPEARIEVGTDTIEVVARVAVGDERERIWAAQKRDILAFGEYERKSGRTIPVVVLEPVPNA